MAQPSLSEVAFVQSLIKKQVFTTMLDPFEPLANSPIKLHCCKDCGDKYIFKSSYMEHIYRDSVKISYQCKSCNIKYYFTNRCSLLNHIRSHIQVSNTIINIADIEVEPSPHHLVTFLYNFKEDRETISMETFSKLKELGMIEPDDSIPPLPVSSLFYEPPKPEKFDINTVINNINKSFELALQELDQKAVELTNDYVLSANASTLCDAMESHNGAPELSKPSDVQNISCNNSMEVIHVDENNMIDNMTSSNNLDNVTSTKEQTSICHYCSKDYKADNFDVKIERAKHYQESTGSLFCTLCKIQFMNICSYKAHQSVHTLEPPFICPECGIELPSVYTFYKHIHQSCFHFTRILSFICSVNSCNAVVPYTDFSKHFISNHVKLIHKCTLCIRAYADSGYYYNHIKNFHNGVIVKPLLNYFCHPCSEKHETNSDINRHANIIHKSQITQVKTVYNCPGCHSLHFHAQNKHHIKNCELYLKTDYAKHLDKICNQQNYTISQNLVKSLCVLCNVVTLRHNPLETPAFCLKCSIKTSDNANFKIVGDSVESMKKNYKDAIIPIKRKFDISDSSKSSLAKKRKRIIPRKKNLHGRSSKNANISGVIISNGLENVSKWLCAKCNLHMTDEASFIDHIKSHRDSSTAYQCMCCGLCFVTKQSLSMHLIIVHGKKDAEAYIKNNDCKCDQPNDTEVEKPNESAVIKENQCRVCFDQFKNSADLDKHFRIHGMAFILANQKNKSTV